MKILHIIGLAHGGAGQHVLSLASECDPRRFESTVAMTANSPMRPQFEKAGVKVLPLALDHYGGPMRNVMAFRQLAEILKNDAFDIIQTHTSVAGALGRVAARFYSHAPVVHMLHAFAGHPYRSGPFRVTARMVERRLDRFTDWYIAGSQAMIRSGVKQKIFTADKVKLISNGIDLTPFRAAELLSRENASATLHTTSDAPDLTVGFLGRLEKQKGAPYLVHAAALVKRQNPRIRFLLAGDGKLRPSLEKLAAELKVEDVVQFVGWQSDTVGFLRQIDVMAMPSLWEAFGLSAAEAMAIEKPVIASGVDGLPEVVEDGVTGILVPPAEPQPLANAILELAADPERRRVMGVEGRNRVEALFSLDSMIERHETFYERVGGERRTRGVPARQRASAEDLALSIHS
jgi:glycosyltransferase involved in cell wall biosynthesis